MSALKQPAITKHPPGTASFYIRVRLPDGAMWEACTEKPRPIADIIKSLEGEYLGYLRALSGEPPPPIAEIPLAGEGTATNGASKRTSLSPPVPDGEMR